MPFSWPFHISDVANMVHWLRPKSILDVGPGDGMYGMIFRRYMDRWYGRYDPSQWVIRIDCLEVYEKYITPLHNYIYTNVFIGDVASKPPEFFEPYDIVFMGDVLEHLPKPQGIATIGRIRSKHLIISLPHGCKIEERNYNGNTAESHLASWTVDDFYELPGWIVRGVNTTAGLMTVLLKREGV